MRMKETLIRWREPIAAIACAAVAVVFAIPMARVCAVDGGSLRCFTTALNTPSTDDWRAFAGAWEAGRVALRDFGQLPSWNPYHCGGVVLFSDPQSPVTGPLFWLFLGLPTALAMKLWIVLHLVAGALGARALVKDYRGNIAEQVLAAAVVSACGFCAEHFGGGHLSFTPFLLFPWVLWAHRRALGDPRWSVLTASLLALTVYEGGTYPLPLMLVGLGADVLSRLGHTSERRAMVLSLPLTALLFVGLSAARLVPILAFLSEHPRLMPLDDQMTVAEVVQAFTARTHDRAFAGHTYVWPEYGDYIGVVPVVLFAIGIVTAVIARDSRTRDRRIDLGLAAVMIWCALGNIPGFSLFGLLHELPVYRSLRVPSRFLYPATVALSLVVARVLIDTRETLDRHRARRFLVSAFVFAECALAVGVSYDLAKTNGPRLHVGADPVIARAPASRTFTQRTDLDYRRWPTFAVQGVGTPMCYVAFDWPVSRELRFGDVQQQQLSPPDAGTVNATSWSPNTLHFTVNLSTPAALVINQNTDTGWATNVGTIDPGQSLLTIELPRGRHELVVTHRPRWFWPGLSLTLASLALLVLIARKCTPERVTRLAASVRRRLIE